MNRRDRFLSVLSRESDSYLPLSVQFAPAKLEEFQRETDGADPYEYFGLDYRHVSVPLPDHLPDFTPYFAGRVPDPPPTPESMQQVFPYRGSSYFTLGATHGEWTAALNEWGEYRVFEERGDYHHKIYPLPGDDVSLADIESFPIPDLHECSRLDGVAEQIDRIHSDGFAAVLSWEMTIFEKSWRIRGLENLMMDFELSPERVECLMDRIAEQTGHFATESARLGVDIVQLGDDVGSQTGMMIAPEVYRRFLKPRMKTLIDRIKRANPKTLVFYHTDGVVDPVVPDFIDIGIDVLNPVQRECMDIGVLKREYGRDLSFWGGLSVQRTLPFGTTAEVERETREIAEVAATGGGLCIAPGHLVERDVPLENLYAFVETVRMINSA